MSNETEDALTIARAMKSCCLRRELPTWAEIEYAADAIFEYEARVDALTKALDAVTGWMLNAKIDLETGHTKASAIRTIDGGLKMAREALSNATSAIHATSTGE